MNRVRQDDGPLQPWRDDCEAEGHGRGAHGFFVGAWDRYEFLEYENDPSALETIEALGTDLGHTWLFADLSRLASKPAKRHGV